MDVLSQYGVYVAKFPFLGVPRYKFRPVVVVGKPIGPHGVIVVIPISSKPDRENVDVELVDWQSAGLIKQSVARVHRITTILQTDLVSKLGVITSNDKKNLTMSLKKLLNL